MPEALAVAAIGYADADVFFTDLTRFCERAGIPARTLIRGPAPVAVFCTDGVVFLFAAWHGPADVRGDYFVLRRPELDADIPLFGIWTEMDKKMSVAEALTSFSLPLKETP